MKKGKEMIKAVKKEENEGRREVRQERERDRWMSWDT